MYQIEIIKSKADAAKIISELDASQHETNPLIYEFKGVSYYDPYANGTGGTVTVWKDEDGNFWTYASGRGWRDQAATRKQDEAAAALQLWNDRKLWNAAERLRQEERR